MERLTYFYRYPNSIYFSIEKLFSGIYTRITRDTAPWVMVKETFLPHPSNWKNIISNILFVRKEQTEINHITGDVHYTILGCSAKAVNVLTIHDCVLLHQYSKRHPRYWILKWLWYDWPVRKADMVTVISENTKEELIHFTHCDPRKIKVIPNYVDPGFVSSPRRSEAGITRILFIGTTPNKNLERLVEAMKGIEARLDIVGFLTDRQMTLLKKYRIDFLQSSGITQDELLQKYIECDLVAFPSTYEGFGLPIIEAQAVGRPVLTSKLSPMHEVAGSGSVLVDPFSVASIREGLLMIINDGELRKKIVADGFINVQRYQLDKIADQYLSIYKDLLKKKQLTN